MTSSTLRRCRSPPAGRGPSRAPAREALARILRFLPVMMLSSTVIPLKSAMFWNVRAMPWRAAAWGLAGRRATPRTETGRCRFCGR